MIFVVLSTSPLRKRLQNFTGTQLILDTWIYIWAHEYQVYFSLEFIFGPMNTNYILTCPLSWPREYNYAKHLNPRSNKDLMMKVKSKYINTCRLSTFLIVLIILWFVKVNLLFSSYVKHLLKQLKIFGSNLIFMNIPLRKEKGKYSYSKSGRDLMPIRSYTYLWL
jgi:hypothetical protein